MNWLEIKDEWPRLRESAQERWPRLRPEELEQVHGNRTELMEMLQEEYGWPLERAGVEVDRWADAVTRDGGGPDD